MDDKDLKRMAEYGITAESRVVFHFGGYRYDRLADAINFAKKEQHRKQGRANARGPGAGVD